MRKFYFLLVAVLCFSRILAQTNPTPQIVPYSQDFSTLSAASTTYPDGWNGWQLATSNTTTFRTNPATADRPLIAGSASSTSGAVYNYNSKLGFLTTGGLDLALALALNTTNKTGIQVSYSALTVRNPYDGSSNTRINEMVLQYRVGLINAFTTVVATAYQNNTTLQTGSGVTTPQNVQTRSTVLPPACDNQASYRFAG